VAAYPADINGTVLKRFGAPDAKADDVAVMAWNDRVIGDYVLPDLRPDVLVNWLGPLDAAQHEFGVGSPQALDALRKIDGSIEFTLNAIRALGRHDQATVFIASDHGFARLGRGVDLSGELVRAGLKKGSSSTDVVVANQAFMASFYVAGREPMRIRQLVEFLQKQDWVNVIFTRPGKGDYGVVPGTFSLDVIKGAHPSRSPDVVVSSSWDSEPNSFGVKGTHASMFSARSEPDDRSGHGGIAPWVIHNTLIASGARIKKRLKIESPASLPDIAPTVQLLFSVDIPSDRGRGRPLRELLEGGPMPPKPTQRVIVVESGGYRASIRLSSVADHDYVDEGTRDR
jgi:predicted AlkP superfamily pyrophosphatase or phosphodiesterase